MEYFGYTMAGIWSAGCFGLPIFGMFNCAHNKEYGTAAMLFFIAWPIGCLFAVLPWALMSAASSPDLATLKKADWVCSASHSETRRGVVSTGKITVPTSRTVMVCDQYNRIGGE